jgi:hypothetical protein
MTRQRDRTTARLDHLDVFATRYASPAVPLQQLYRSALVEWRRHGRRSLTTD